MHMRKLLQANLIRTGPVRARTARDRAQIAQMWRARRAERAAN